MASFENLLTTRISARWQLVIFGFIQLFILLIWVNFSAFDVRIHPDVELYFKYGNFMAAGQMPYRDFAVEYPPLAFLILIIPRIFSSTLMGYANGLAVLMFMADLAGLVMVSGLARKLGFSHWKSLAIYSISFWALGDIAINRFDVIPAILALGAIYFFIRGNRRISWFVLALGVLTKLYPVVLVPLLALPYLYKRKYRPLLKDLGIFVATGLFVAIPFVIMSPSGFWDFIQFHSARGIQLESGYSSLLILGNMLGLVKVEVIQAAASVDIQSSMSGFLVSASTYIMALSLGGVYWIFWKRLVRESFSPRTIVNFSLAAIAILLITSKIFSTQFIIWLYPLAALVSGKLRNTAWIMVAIAAVLSIYIYPRNYGQLMELAQPAVTILLVRNALILGLAVILLGSRANEFRQPVQAGLSGSEASMQG